MFKIVWTNKCKSLRKKKRKRFDERRKTSSAKSILTHTNSLYIIQQYIIQIRYIDHGWTPSTPAINIARTNAKVELSKIAENNASIMKKKQGAEVTRTLPKPGIKRKEVNIFLQDVFDSSILLELLFALRFSLCNDGTYASKRSWKQQEKKKRMCDKNFFYFPQGQLL